VTGQRRRRLWESIADRAVTPDHSGWAQAICAVSAVTLATVEASALTLRAKPRVQEVLASSDGWSAKLEETQYTLGEGPGIQAFVDGSPVLVDDLAAEHTRWPVFAEAALRLDAMAVFAFPLQVGAIRIGTLNLYRRRPGRLPADALADSAVLVDLATTALLEHFDATEHAALDWARPIGSYQDINVATGMIAGRLRISLDDAFARLRGHAFADDRSVLKVARDVVELRINLDQFAEP
jgi:hypothetical protein